MSSGPVAAEWLPVLLTVTVAAICVFGARSFCSPAALSHRRTQSGVTAPLSVSGVVPESVKCHET